MEKLTVSKRSRRPTHKRRFSGVGFFKKAAIIGSLLLLTALPFANRVRAEEPHEPKDEPKKELVWKYPNFSGAGTLGNPALWPQTGSWGFIQFGKNKDGSIPLLLMVNAEVIDSVFLTTSLQSNPQQDSESLNIGMAFPLGAGFILGGSIITVVDSSGEDIKLSTGSRVGLLHVLDLSGFLLRNGIDHSSGDNITRLATEARFLAGPLELTFSGNTSFVIVGGEKDYLGQHVGTQIRWQRVMLSFGIGGEDIADWNNTHSHFRLFASDRVFFDVHLLYNGTIFERTSLGTTIMF